LGALNFGMVLRWTLAPPVFLILVPRVDATLPPAVPDADEVFLRPDARPADLLSVFPKIGGVGLDLVFSSPTFFAEVFAMLFSTWTGEFEVENRRGELICPGWARFGDLPTDSGCLSAEEAD
jgi:hypothetical protein